MARPQSFRAKLELVPHGGQYVVVPQRIADAAGLEYAARVRGTVNGSPYRSSLMKYSGVFHMGVPKASLAQAGVKPGTRVALTIELDDQPLPTDVVPADLAKRLAASAAAERAWQALRPSLKREHVKQLLAAKKPETRARRLEATLRALLQSSVKPRSRG